MGLKKTKKLVQLVLSSLIITTTTAVFADAAPVGRREVQEFILMLQPEMPSKQAAELARLLVKYSRKYGTNPLLSVAIAMQESSLTNKDRVDPVTKLVTDIGFFQFNTGTIRAYKLDSRKLKRNLEYAVEQHTKLLAMKMFECATLYPTHAWTCYHSRTPKLSKQYLQLVSRWLSNSHVSTEVISEN